MPGQRSPAVSKSSVGKHLFLSKFRRNKNGYESPMVLYYRAGIYKACSNLNWEELLSLFPMLQKMLAGKEVLLYSTVALQ